MASFPSFVSGSYVAQFPFVRSLEFVNSTAITPAGVAASWYFRSTPLLSWELKYSVSDAELDTLKAFFLDRWGRYKTFSFTDPRNGITYPRVRFDQDAIVRRATEFNSNSVEVRLVQLP